MAQQLWAVNSLGGFLHSDIFSKSVRHAAQPLMKFRQFVDAEAVMGNNSGDAVLFAKIIHYLIANVLAIIVAAIFAYILNDIWTFAMRRY